MVPEPDTYYIDPVHSTVGFAAALQDLVPVHGRFSNVSGVVWVHEEPATSSASVTIETAGIDTGIERRDNHLRSPEFLDVERYPTMSWRGTGVEATDDPRTWVFHGVLTLRDRSIEVPLTGQFLGDRAYPFGAATLVSCSAVARIDRFAFGIEAMPPSRGAKLFIGRYVDIYLDIALINADISFFTQRFMGNPVIDKR
ncbi:YceI family protein [Salinactinospora qingdaonensis]|uniref:YceI family protein n=1 Tax=Salinactinospora qingdaonensis TaxID=702744 RepID=A0ABP7FW30_9ACTN